MVICSLDSLKRSSKKKEARIEKEIVVLLEKVRNNEILGLDLVFVSENNTDFNFIFCYYWLFSKSQFSGI